MNKHKSAENLLVRWAVKLAADFSADITDLPVSTIKAEIVNLEKLLALRPLMMTRAFNMADTASQTRAVLKEMYATLAANIQLQSLKHKLFGHEEEVRMAAFNAHLDLIFSKHHAERDAHRPTDGLSLDPARYRYISRANRAAGAAAASLSPAAPSGAEAKDAPRSTDCAP